MFLIAGLGNPGREYEYTKHNIGFRVVSNLADKHKIRGEFSSKFKALVGKGNILGIDTIIVEPLTFMNCSGFSILTILNWYKIDLSNLIVVYDDMDINLGKIRFRPDGSDGGHKGVKSIIEHAGGKTDFNRLRVGIGPRPDYIDRINFVLTTFSPEQEKLLSKTINLATEGLEHFVKEDIQSAMNKYNGTDLVSPAIKTKIRSGITIDLSWVNLEKKGLLTELPTNNNICNTIFPINLLNLKKGL